MQIKRYQAKSVSDALRRVKRELGPDAVILSTQKVRAENGTMLVEIAAAIDNQPAISTRHDSRAPSPDYSNTISKQLEEIKDTLLLMLSSKHFFPEIGPNNDLAALYNTLMLQGVNEIIAWELIQSLSKKLKEELSMEKVRLEEKFREVLAENIPVVEPFRENRDRATLFYSFVGPTGSGKTTTLAKIAAFLKLEMNLSVAFISLDTYRIGAIEQLKIYAQILDVPLKIGATVQQFANAVLDFSNLKTDVVLVDTIGKNFLHESHVRDLENILGNFPQIKHFLVLPANAKDSDLKTVVKAFASIPAHSFIFTKIDETTTYGNVINQLIRFRKPVSFLGTGQRVPEDLQKANKKGLCNLLMNNYRN